MIAVEAMALSLPQACLSASTPGSARRNLPGGDWRLRLVATSVWRSAVGLEGCSCRLAVILGVDNLHCAFTVRAAVAWVSHQLRTARAHELATVRLDVRTRVDCSRGRDLRPSRDLQPR